jgi:hypothetical protein
MYTYKLRIKSELKKCWETIGPEYETITGALLQLQLIRSNMPQVQYVIVKAIQGNLFPHIVRGNI